MIYELSQKKSPRFTYKKRLGNRNLQQIPARITGEIHTWYTASVKGIAKIACLPDQWEDRDDFREVFKYVEPIPENIPDSAIHFMAKDVMQGE